MAEYVIVDPNADPDAVLGKVTVNEDSGAALVHDLIDSDDVVQFDTLDQVREILAFMRPGYEIRGA